MTNAKLVRADGSAVSSRALKRRAAPLGISAPPELLRTLEDQTKPARTRGKAAYLLSAPETFEQLSTGEQRRAAQAALRVFWEDKPHLAWGAANLLKTTGKRGAWKGLTGIAVSRKLSSKTRFNAVYALNMLSEKKAVPTLASIVRDRTEPTSLRALAAEALGASGYGSARAVTVLIDALADRSSEVRLFAANALAMCGNERAIPDLEKLLADRSVVRQYGSVASEAAQAITSVRARTRPKGRAPRASERRKKLTGL